jgi:hypothetical protein
VLLNPGLETRAGGAADAERDLDPRHTARATRSWGRCKLAKGSSFAFLEAGSPVYISKLVCYSLGVAKLSAETMRRRSSSPLSDLVASLEGRCTGVGPHCLLRKGFAP